MSPIAEVGSAFVSVMPSAKGFGSKLDSQVSGDLKNSGSKAGKIFGGALKLGALGVLAGAAVVGNFLKGSIDEAREAQKVGALTESTIKATGGAAKITAGQVGAMAERLSALTGIDDETIQSGENMLLTFKNIRNEVGGKFVGTFDEATATLVDMSSALGTEPKQAAIQLGKALNDPIKGVSALSRVGVTFTDGQKKVIEQLVKTGDTAGAQKVILHELNSEFGGAAQAQATAGDKMEVAWGNLKETAGNAILPIVDGILPKLTDAINWLSDKGVPAVQRFWDNLAPAREAVSQAAKGVAHVVGAIRDGDWKGAWDKARNAARAALGSLDTLARKFLQDELAPAIRTGMGKVRASWARQWQDFWKDPDRAYDKVLNHERVFSNTLIGRGERTAKEYTFTMIRQWQKLPGAAAHEGTRTLNAWRQSTQGMPTLASRIGVDVVGGLMKGLSKMPDNARAVATRATQAIVTGIGNAASLLFPAGQQVVQGLIDGIGSMLGSLGGKMADVAQTIKDHLPGSPVKTGPLTSWNNGGAGKRLIDQGIIAGLDARRSHLSSAMDRLSAGIAVRGPGVLAAAGAGGGGRAALTITNWDEGVGFIEYVADGRIHGADQLAGETARAM